MKKYQDLLLEDFTSPIFRQCFQLYFQELGIHVKDWDGLFQEMNADGRGNRAYLRMENGRPVGFIQFCGMELSGWFFTKQMGFIRELWIAPEYRGQGHGTALLALAEEELARQGAAEAVLTTDTAPDFYVKNGYRHDPGFTAKNGDPVYVKALKPSAKEGR